MYLYYFNTIPIPVSVEEINNTQIGNIIYPNPATDYVIFERQGTQANLQIKIKLQIINTLGQIVDSFEIHSNQTIWDTEEINPGIYFYKIEGSNYSGKVVIRRD